MKDMIPLVNENGKAIKNRDMKKLVPVEKRELDLPITAYRQFGCYNCEWRGTRICDYGFPRGTGRKLDLGKLGKEFEGICEKRLNWLRSIYTGTSKGTVGLKQLRRDWRDWNLEHNMRKRTTELQVLEEELEVAKEKQDLVKVKELEERSDILHDHIFKIGINMNKLDEHEKDRISGEKNVEKLTGKLDLGTIHRVMIDAEYKEKKDDD